jgi:hypothetical protein
MQINTGIIVAEVHLGILEQIVILVSTPSTISYSHKNTFKRGTELYISACASKESYKKKCLVKKKENMLLDH